MPILNEAKTGRSNRRIALPGFSKTYLKLQMIFLTYNKVAALKSCNSFIASETKCTVLNMLLALNVLTAHVVHLDEVVCSQKKFASHHH